MKAHVINPKYPTTIIAFIEIFKSACDTKDIHEGAAMWALPYFVHEKHSNLLNSSMYSENGFAPFAVSVRNQEQKFRELPKSYFKKINYLFGEVCHGSSNWKAWCFHSKVHATIVRDTAAAVLQYYRSLVQSGDQVWHEHNKWCFYRGWQQSNSAELS